MSWDRGSYVEILRAARDLGCNMVQVVRAGMAHGAPRTLAQEIRFLEEAEEWDEPQWTYELRPREDVAPRARPQFSIYYFSVMNEDGTVTYRGTQPAEADGSQLDGLTAEVIGRCYVACGVRVQYASVPESSRGWECTRPRGHTGEHSVRSGVP